MNVPQSIATIVTTFFTGLALFLPQFLAGLLLLLVGLLIASIMRQVVMGFFNLIKIDQLAKEAKLSPALDFKVWPTLIAELLRWIVLVLFLVAAVETWGIKGMAEVLNTLLLYLPNVFVAVIILLTECCQNYMATVIYFRQQF